MALPVWASARAGQKYLYLPEEQNDFIFAIICEELGFIGAALIIILFALLIIRAIGWPSTPETGSAPCSSWASPPCWPSRSF